MNINKRLFGTPIQGTVREKLEERQSTVGETEFGESVKIPKTSDLSSRTPFVRMWTSVKIIDPAAVADTFAEATYNGSTPDSDFLFDNDIDEQEMQVKLEEQRRDIYGKTKPHTVVVPIKDKNGKILKWVYKDSRDQVDYSRMIYEIGNHKYQTSYGAVDTNASIQYGDNVGERQDSSEENQNMLSKDYVDNIFPQELKDNPLLKPQSGITSITSETEGTMGIIKKTTVNFTVHNFYDYDRIYNKYFLSPGATIFVDFGWSDIKNLYRPEELINSSNIQDFLYSDGSREDTENKESVQVPLGKITEAEGDLEILQGLVTDYNSKILPNGSVECSVTLTSSNSALMSQETDNNTVTHIRQILTRGIVYLGLTAVLGNKRLNEAGYDDDEDNDLKQLQTTPGADDSGVTIENYNKNLRNLSIKALSGATGPEGNSIRTGVFVDSLDADNIYMAWGLFEDMIINSQFGFGKNEEDINGGNSFQVRIDSSNSYTSYDQFFIEKQHVLFKVPEDEPMFLYPKWWGDSDPLDDKELASTYIRYNKNAHKSEEENRYNDLDKGAGSYSFQNGKIPSDTTGDYGNPTSETTKIPIREVFVNVKTIIEAFEAESSLRKVLKNILDTLNEDSEGMFNWIVKGYGDSEIQIVDKNITEKDAKEKVEVLETGEVDLFTFNIMSPNSIVKDYNLEFKLPSGNIGNMYAVQGMSHGNSVFSLKDSVDDCVAIAGIDDESLSIIYEPDLGSHRLEQLLDEHQDVEAYNVFNQMNDLVSNNLYTVNAPNRIESTIIQNQGGMIQSPMSSSKATTDSKDKDENNKAKPAEIIKRNNERLQLKGLKVAKDFTDYYKIKSVTEIKNKRKSNLLPYTLSLTTYGISSLQPGDSFAVDYLPKMYLKNTYLQIIKISHAIGPGGWYTSLDTQFRLVPGRKEQITNQIDRDIVRLSPTVLHNLGIEDKIQADAGFFSRGTNVKIAELTPYMTNLKIVHTPESAFDFSITFDIIGDLKGTIGGKEGELAQEGGNIKNDRGSFYADFFGSARATALENYPKLAAVYGTPQIKGINPENAVSPPDVKITPNGKYDLLRWGDKIAILDRGKDYYQETKAFFTKYLGVIS